MHMMLCLASIILNTIDVIFMAFFVDKLGAVVDPVMFKIAHIQYILARKNDFRDLNVP